MKVKQSERESESEQVHTVEPPERPFPQLPLMAANRSSMCERERDNRSRLLISRGVADLRRPLSQQRALYWPIGSHKNRLVDISGDNNCGRNRLNQEAGGPQGLWRLQ